MPAAPRLRTIQVRLKDRLTRHHQAGRAADRPPAVFKVLGAAEESGHCLLADFAMDEGGLVGHHLVENG